MAVFNSQIASAKRMIAKYGQFCRWSQPNEIEDPDNPWNGGGEEPTMHEKIKIVFFPNDGKTFTRKVGGDVPIGNTIAYMAAVNFTPKINDTIYKADGTPVTVLTIDPLSPNGESILFTIECNE